MSDVHLRQPDLVRSVAAHPPLADQWRDPIVERLER